MNGRNILALLILLQFSTIAFANCAGYTDSFDVRVLDANLRPIEGAGVTVTYDRGTTFGSQYFTTPVNYTGPSGVLHYNILNQGTNTRTIDCSITVNATSSGENRSVVVQADAHGPTVDLPFNDIYPVYFYVRDQLNAPIPDAGVTIGNLTARTDTNGLVKSFLETGNYSYFASYKNAEGAGVLNVTNDTTFSVIFPYYKIRVEADDDVGQPLNATLTIFNQTFVMQNGVFENDKTFGDSVPYSVQYQGIVSQDVIVPASNPIVKVNFDLHSPVFGQITPSMVNNRANLGIEVSDPGEFASGVNVSSIKTSYKIEPSDATTPWNEAVTFTSGRNKFTSNFPELPPNTIVDFRIEVKDNAGNRADIEGKFSTFAEANPQNNTQNQTNTQPGTTQNQGIPLWYIIGGGIVVILAIIVVFRMKSKATRSS